MTDHITVHVTKYTGLGYAYIEQRHCWMFIALDTKKPVGWSAYMGRDELLADLARFARDNWGEFV